MADLLSQVRRDIDNRLSELRPVLEEVRRLEHAREALARTDGRRDRHRAPGGKSGAKRSRMTKAKSQEIDRRVLALLSADPVQKPGALALLTDTSVPSMNARLTRLIREGAIKKRKRKRVIHYEVQPVAAQSTG